MTMLVTIAEVILTFASNMLLCICVQLAVFICMKLVFMFCINSPCVLHNHCQCSVQ